MRYIKVLLLAIFIFLALVFFFQNQGPLSQPIELTFNLFFIPPFTAIPLPFYFIVLAAFLIGCLLALCLLLWDRFMASARLIRAKTKIRALNRQIETLQKIIDADAAKKPEGAINLAKKEEAEKDEKKNDKDDYPEHKPL